ncbi:MAG: ABC transporter permease [Planctomycetota bacterium]
MTQPAFAILGQSLRESTRSRHLRIARTVVAAAAYLVLVLSVPAVADPGRRLFLGMAMLDLLVITVTAAFYFTVVLGELREEWRQGPLRLTRLTPASLLAGKAAAMLFAAIELFAAQVPFALLTVGLGGVQVSQILSTYVILGSYLVVGLAVALLGSILFSRQWSAILFTSVVLLAFLFGAELLGMIAVGGAALGCPPGVTTYLQAAASAAIWSELPGARILAILGNTADVSIVTRSDLCLVAAAVGAIALLVLAFDARGRGALTIRRGTTVRTPAGRPPRGARAITWKDFHHVVGGRRAFVVRGVAYAALCAAAWRADLRSGAGTAGLPTALFIAGVVLVVEAGFVAGRVLREEVREGTLNLLRTVPSPHTSVLDAKLRCCWLAMAPAAVAFTALGVTATLRAGGGFSSTALGLSLAALLVASLYCYVNTTLLLSLTQMPGAPVVALGIVVLAFFLGAVVAGPLAPIVVVLFALLIRSRTRARLREWHD